MKNFYKQLVVAALVAVAVTAPAYAQVDTTALTTGLTDLAVTVGVIFTAIFGYNVVKMIGRKTAALGSGR